MKVCPYCGFSNYDQATECRKCQAIFITQTSGGGTGTVYKPHLVSPQTARDIRGKALSLLVLGLLIKVYWGGYGPWPVIDSPTLVSLRGWLEPLFLYGGAVGYIVGWLLSLF